ncbi:MAG: hypothetical protein GF313_04620 [Caldithrix sp.]|nr:hypothetical protein [Caldithrix sp.]
MKSRLIWIVILFSAKFLSANGYFQQSVQYEIDVTLQPKTKNYYGQSAIHYTNNSPDTLKFIWLHLYANAYKNEKTPFAKQKSRQLSSRFYFSKQEYRGYINVQKASVNGQGVSLQYKNNAPDAAKITLPQPLRPNDSLTLSLSFEGKFPITFSRMGHFGDGYFAASQWYPKIVVYDQFGWHPDSYLDQGEFYGEFGRFDVQITLPENYVVDATGMRQPDSSETAFLNRIIAATDTLLALDDEDKREAFIEQWKKDRRAQTDYDKTKTVRFVAENVHDFAWFAGDFYMMMQTRTDDNKRINVLATPDNAYGWRDVPRFVTQTLEFYGREVGPYQYPKASVVDGALAAGGGMEYPMVTIISTPHVSFTNLLEMVVMHEVGHNWFYGMLGSNERDYPFLDEGLNSFYEHKYMNHYHGFRNMTNFKKIFGGHQFINDIGEWHLLHFTYGSALHKRIDQPLNLPAEDYASMFTYSAITYQKSTAFLRALEWYVGEQRFSEAMHHYFDTWAGRHPTDEDFFQAIEESTGEQLDWLIQPWYRETSYNDFVITDEQTHYEKDKYRTVIRIKNKGTMRNMPAPVHLITEAGDTLEKRWSGKPDNAVTFVHNAPKKKAEVNYSRVIFESNYLNNSGLLPPIDVNFIGKIPDFQSYHINILPYYWYDYFKDKNRIGLSMWSGNPVTANMNMRGALYYGTASESFGHSAKISHRFHLPIANYTDISLQSKNMDGLRRYSLAVANHIQSINDRRRSFEVSAGLDYINLFDMTYNDPRVFNQQKYSVAWIGVKQKWNRLLHRVNWAFAVERALEQFGEQSDYFKFEFQSRYKYRIDRKSFVQLRLLTGGLWGSAVPSQEYLYSVGGVDAKHKRFAPARRGTMGPANRWLFDGGLEMAGYADPANSFFRGRGGAALHIDFDYKWLPHWYFAAATMGPSFEEIGNQSFTETGVKVDFGPLQFVFPIYISDPGPGESHTAFRFNLRLMKDVSRMVFSL